MEEETVLDEQTGKSFKLEPEKGWDIAAAIFSILYLVAMLAFFSWQLVETCVGQGLLLKLFLPKGVDYPNSPLYRLMAYTVIGGGLGGIVNGIRSFISWHAERKAFGRRYVWKYITLPLLGAVLAAIVYAIVRGGIAALGGSYTPGEGFTNQAMSAFAIGALSGYGSHKVFKWLDGHVNKLFRITPIIEVTVPDLKGKSQSEVEVALKQSDLKLGKVSQKVSADPSEFSKVIDQNPLAGSTSLKGGLVDITIAIKAS